MGLIQVKVVVISMTASISHIYCGQGIRKISVGIVCKNTSTVSEERLNSHVFSSRCSSEVYAAMIVDPNHEFSAFINLVQHIHLYALNPDSCGQVISHL
jgi:protein-arginine kinase